MNEDKLYTAWKQHRRRVAVPDDFAGRVISRLNEEIIRDGQTSWIWRQAWSVRLMRWSGALVLVLVGLFRLSFITATLLAP